MMKLVKSLQKTLNPFTKMVKKSNKLMFLLGVLLLLGLVLLVKMYMKKREGFNENDIIVLENIGIQSVSGGYKMVHREVTGNTNVRDARFTNDTNTPPSPLTIKYNRSDNTFTIHADWGDKVWNFVISNNRASFYEPAGLGISSIKAEFSTTATAIKMRIFYTQGRSYRIVMDNMGMELRGHDGSENAEFVKHKGTPLFYFHFIDTADNNKKIDLFAKISEIEMSGLKTKFDLDVQPTNIDNAITKIKTKYTTDFKRELKNNFDVEFTDTNKVNNVVGKAKTKYDGLQTVLKNQRFMYRPAPTPSPT